MVSITGEFGAVVGGLTMRSRTLTKESILLDATGCKRLACLSLMFFRSSSFMPSC